MRPVFCQKQNKYSQIEKEALSLVWGCEEVPNLPRGEQCDSQVWAPCLSHELFFYIYIWPLTNSLGTVNAQFVYGVGTVYAQLRHTLRTVYG